MAKGLRVRDSVAGLSLRVVLLSVRSFSWTGCLAWLLGCLVAWLLGCWGFACVGWSELWDENFVDKKRKQQEKKSKREQRRDRETNQTNDSNTRTKQHNDRKREKNDETRRASTRKNGG